MRELDERLGFSELIAQHMTDSRGKNAQFPLADLLRQSIYSRLAGYEDVNDVEHHPEGKTVLAGNKRCYTRTQRKAKKEIIAYCSCLCCWFRQARTP